MTHDDDMKLPLLLAAATWELGEEFHDHPVLKKWAKQKVPLLDRHSFEEVCQQLVDQVRADVKSERSRNVF